MPFGDRAMTIAAAVVAFAFSLALALGHAGMSSWIQGLNYLVAGFPTALAMISLARARATREPRARRMFVYCFTLATAIDVLAWTHVEEHERELKSREQAVEAAVARGDFSQVEADGREVWFRHSISRRHVLDRASGRWRDEDAR